MTGTDGGDERAEGQGEDEQRDDAASAGWSEPSSFGGLSSSCLVMLASPNCSTAMRG